MLLTFMHHLKTQLFRQHVNIDMKTRLAPAVSVYMSVCLHVFQGMLLFLSHESFIDINECTSWLHDSMIVALFDIILVI